MCSASQVIRVTWFAQPSINPLAGCICWTGLLGHGVFPPWNEGPNFGSYNDGVITNLVPDILECEVKWALASITMNKASTSDASPIELFQILKDDAVKVLHSICQQMWKTEQWPQDWKRSVFIPIHFSSLIPKMLMFTPAISYLTTSNLP